MRDDRIHTPSLDLWGLPGSRVTCLGCPEWCGPVAGPTDVIVQVDLATVCARLGCSATDDGNPSGLPICTPQDQGVVFSSCLRETEG